MATKSKKNKVVVEDADRGFMAAFQELGKEKGIGSDVLFDLIEQALIRAYSHNFHAAQNVSVTLDRTTGSYHVYSIKTVVENVQDPIQEISLAMAQQISPNYALGDTLEIEVAPAKFGRIAAQHAKQMVVQRLREAERTKIYDEYVKREFEVVTGIVQRVDVKNIYIDLGKTEAIMPAGDQIPTEKYSTNDRIKALITGVRSETKGPQVLVSRTHPDLLRRLFELEVPEIHDGTVEIKSVAREAGMRSKIAVYAKDEAVDPIGSCVGHRGFRVQAIVDELRNEKIDVVKWNVDPGIYISNALSPAKVLSVEVNEVEKMSRVVVPDNQLSLAIGKEGQNARLAAKLTGWKIDIKSESQAAAADSSWNDIPLAEISSANMADVAVEPQEDGVIAGDLDGNFLDNFAQEITMDTEEASEDNQDGSEEE